MGLLSGIPAAWWAHICIGFRVIYGRWEDRRAGVRNFRPSSHTIPRRRRDRRAGTSYPSREEKVDSGALQKL